MLFLQVQITQPSGSMDKALTELNTTYLRDLQNKRFSKMLTLNSRYVSNVSIGYRMKPTTSHSRYEPYKNRKERHRTKSENCEVEENCCHIKSVVDKLDNSLEDIIQLKRAKSLESIIAESNQHIDLKNINIIKLNELENVSNSIQNLRVVE